MPWIARLLATIVAVEHVWFLVLEMFLWRSPLGRRTFGTTPEFAESTASLMMNQGLYNGFLAAGLAWGVFSEQRAVVAFFLGCVVVAGLFGGATVKRTILLVQALPAALALAATLLLR